ncbi:MAG: hypothetical protein LUQ18_05905, partial [Methylococcaceae bacterium]|nr:hypothetical protein [Methylococcaceae bacterium]
SGAAVSLVCPEDAYLLVEIEKLLKRQIPRIADTGYEPVSLKVIDAPKKNAPHKDTGKKDYRHSKDKTKATDNKRGTGKPSKPNDNRRDTGKPSKPSDSRRGTGKPNKANDDKRGTGKPRSR